MHERDAAHADHPGPTGGRTGWSSSRGWRRGSACSRRVPGSRSGCEGQRPGPVANADRHGIAGTGIGIPGGSNLPLYDAIPGSGIRHILARHEQGAGFIAQGMARSTGKTAVCFATSGPGATNLITAVADAKADSIPMVAVTGQVGGSFLGTDAFQEVDTYGLSLPVAKHAFLIRRVEELADTLTEAFSIAVSGRPGPVIVDIPKDVQLRKIEVSSWPKPAGRKNPAAIDPDKIRAAADLIKKSRRPVLYGGGGIIHSGAAELLTEFSRKHHFPTAMSLMGLGSFPEGDMLYLGMIGMHGSAATNKIMDEADLIIAAGARFDDRATGKVEGFCSGAKIIHCDIDAAELEKIRPAELAISGDAAEFFRELLKIQPEEKRPEWLGRIEKIRQENPAPEYPDEHPAAILKTIASQIPEDAIITTDVGQHQMWTAQHYPFKKPRTFLTSGGMGTMGFGFPAAIGASLENSGKKTVCISGDGSFLMNIQELATLAELDADIAVIIFNNGHLGLVRQQQELFYGKNYSACRFEKNPDFTAIARGFGIRSERILPGKNFRKDLNRILSEKGPVLIDLPVNPEYNVLPMVPPGAANTTMIGG